MRVSNPPNILFYIFVDTMSDFKGLRVSSGNSVMKLCPVGPQGPTYSHNFTEFPERSKLLLLKTITVLVLILILLLLLIIMLIIILIIVSSIASNILNAKNANT